MCETTVFTQVMAPDGRTNAKVQMTDCGATTGYSRVVMLEQRGLFTQECRALALKGTPEVGIRWQRGGLQINHNTPPAAVIASENVCFGHKIEVRQEQ